MAVISITRNAKCSDCRFCKRFSIGKLTRHKCNNSDSERFENNITLKDLVCNNWKL